MPPLAQRLDDGGFLVGRQLGEDRICFHSCAELLRRHGRYIAPKQDVIGFHSHLLADCAGDEVIVTGEDLDRDT